MDAEDFRRLALALPGAKEGSHMGAPDFRVGGRIFATLASQDQGFGNLMLTPDQQALFIEQDQNVFLPVKGGWGRNGVTHVRLAGVSDDMLGGALHAAWRLRTEKNAGSAARSGRTAKSPGRDWTSSR